MASHVVVIDSTARRSMIKTTPNKNLSEVLEEACGKLGLNPAQYGLKHNNKQVDLSRTIRLSGLSSGAKLELVQLSKSAGVVSIALQLPESEARGTPSARLTDRFPSSTTLWLVLRKFEAGVAGGTERARNFTARGVPSTRRGTSGAGRLYYEQPVLQVMNRELSSFTDLQKPLVQLGLNSGTALLRLSFRATETPLEEAMAQIQGYFESVEGSTVPGTPSPEIPSSNQPAVQADEEKDPIDKTPSGPAPQPQEQPLAPSSPQPEQSSSATSRPVSVFRPPSSSTPSAARVSHNEADYTPTVEHAHVHQKLLQQNSRNVRLPTEAELVAQANEEAAKLAAVKAVEIKIRFPDQSAVSAKFGQIDTAADLYHFVRECLEEKWRLEAFMLRNPGIRGKNEVIPDDGAKKLIRDLQLKGRVLVVFGWDDKRASVPARSAKAVLKEELRAQAQELKVQDIPDVQDDKDDPGVKVNTAKKEMPAEESSEGKMKLPKWLKGLSKK
ncbi:uncharacterized protein Z518_10490 [Rhinocladiella mackenziei CBS 650.93]|uniref:Rhinocladiella mackenziei CBS 650.93 unplaced genomic scaffold supercont1.9, whole genome shotgun sequence n=1 Tax=Rhinocladiella mackenziei CBS 650.93 TaxID=1442369 RepID=A0A0D2IAR0_9EURO|nr:uncharacterized protein Z518_10490 [Rhinocladiella mackenziei CBS 650.93]KIX00351.1 hypothetical protein Z518_10490 [Rhinocladiella mackenziei CBS 650.93]